MLQKEIAKIYEQKIRAQMENKVLEAAHTIEQQVTSKIREMEDMSSSELERLRDKRVLQMKRDRLRQKRWQSKGRGTYERIAESDFFDLVPMRLRVTVRCVCACVRSCVCARALSLPASLSPPPSPDFLPLPLSLSCTSTRASSCTFRARRRRAVESWTGISRTWRRGTMRPCLYPWMRRRASSWRIAWAFACCRASNSSSMARCVCV